MSVQEPNLPYGGTTGERLKQFALNAELRDRISALAARYWEVAAYSFLVAAAAIMRFYNLGARAMHHDESLHGFFSYGFTKGLRDFFTFAGPDDTYKHVPFMHGPFQFIGNGTVMAIFGDGNYQARILAAAMGTGLVLLPFLLRRQLGRSGALFAAAFIAISPTLMYYSRFTREDIYTAFWTFGLVIFLWRYMASQEDKWLYLAAGFMAGFFLTKETSFMTVAAFLVFFDFLLAQHLSTRIRAKSVSMNDITFGALTAGMMVAAPVIAIGWPLFKDWRAKYDINDIPPAGVIVIVMGSLAITQYSAAIQMLPFFGKTWQLRAGESGDLHIASQEQTVAMVTIFALIGISAAIGLTWRARTWALAAASFWIPFILLSTTIFTNWRGFFSVMWGSMDYWISQQDVARGNQPDYYYFITIPVYEYLTLGLSLAAMAYFAIRGRRNNAIIYAAGLLAVVLSLLAPDSINPAILKVDLFHVWVPFGLILLGVFIFDMKPFDRFLVFWLVTTYFALTVASEKMPWLNVHIALPLAVLAARFVDEILNRGDIRDDLPSLEKIAPFLYAAIASALAIVVFVIVGPFSLASAGGWILVIVAAASVYWAYSGYSRKTAIQVAMVGAVAAFAVFTFRAAYLASWGHPNLKPGILDTIATRDRGDVPVELLVYTQTSGDIPKLQTEIDKAARQSGLGNKMPIVVDSTDGYTWPWAWYLRHYTAVSYTTISQGYTPPQGAILLISRGAAANVNLNGQYGDGIPYHHRRWFPEEYRGPGGNYSPQDFFTDLVSKSAWSTWLDYWVRRTPPAEIGTVDGVAFFPKGYSVDVTAPPTGPTVRTDGAQLVIGGNGVQKGQLSGPSDVTFDAQGNIYVADTNNNRIEKYDAQGNFQAAAGGFGGDITMNQPWSMVVDADGTIFVADTWNHQIIKLDKDFKQVKKWGSGGQVDAGGDPMKLFGPRKIALTPDGNVIITDTGNSRVVEYTKDGDFVRQFGAKGTSGDPLQFSEPASLAVASNGDIYVADFWNKRIVHFDKDLQSKGIIPVGSWGSTAVTDRPYLAILADGRVLATDPTNGKILVFGTDGAALGTYDLPKEGAQASARPIGIATDGTSVLVSDSAGSVVRKIPLSEIIR